MFALLSAFIPLIPGLIQAGVVTYETFTKVKTLIDEDRAMTPQERAELEKMIAERQAVLDDTTRDATS